MSPTPPGVSDHDDALSSIGLPTGAKVTVPSPGKPEAPRARRIPVTGPEHHSEADKAFAAAAEHAPGTAEHTGLTATAQAHATAALALAVAQQNAESAELWGSYLGT